MDKETGAFEKEGSIYSEAFAQYFPSLREKYQAQEAVEDQDIVIKSSSARTSNLTVGPDV